MQSGHHWDCEFQIKNAPAAAIITIASATPIQKTIRLQILPDTRGEFFPLPPRQNPKSTTKDKHPPTANTPEA